MEVSAVPSNMNYPEGGDYGNRAPSMGYLATPNDPRGDYYTPAPRGQNIDYAQQVPTMHGSCSHCQTHCCQRPAQPAGSRGERLERYVVDIPNEATPAPSVPQATSSRNPVQEAHYNPVAPSSLAEPPPVQQASYDSVSPHAHPSPNQMESSSIPQQQPAERAACHQEASSSHEPCQQAATASSYLESPFIESTIPSVSQTRLAPVAVSASAPALNPTPSQQTVRPQGIVYDSVASLMVPPKPSPSRIQDLDVDKFSPASLTHLNFKEKQLAMSAVKKAATNMHCVKMFMDKDKQNCGTIGKRDFQIVMDRIGVLRGMSSREIDAVFKGFSTQTDTEIDYKKFSAACRHAIDNDSRLARMAQK